MDVYMIYVFINIENYIRYIVCSLEGREENGQYKRKCFQVTVPRIKTNEMWKGFQWKWQKSDKINYLFFCTYLGWCISTEYWAKHSSQKEGQWEFICIYWSVSFRSAYVLISKSRFAVITDGISILILCIGYQESQD